VLVFCAIVKVSVLEILGSYYYDRSVVDVDVAVAVVVVVDPENLALVQALNYRQICKRTSGGAEEYGEG
jgi:hypothetical protein